MKKILGLSMKLILCVVLFGFTLPTADAVLPPSAYADSQVSAGEKLSMRVLVVDVIGQEGGQKITVQAEVLKVMHTESSLSPGSRIIIAYEQSNTLEGEVGPAPIPLLREERETLAFLNRRKDGFYSPAAGPMSFGPDVSPPEVFEAIHFDYDRVGIPPDEIHILQKNARIILRNPDFIVLLTGHTDERGGDDYNMALGEGMAQHVKESLMDMGVPDKNLRILSYGEEAPLDNRSTEEAWAKNRRVEFHLHRLNSEGKSQ